jgi:hypothetical protein
MHELHDNFVSLTQIHLVFFLKNKCYFLLFFFNIKLIHN